MTQGRRRWLLGGIALAMAATRLSSPAGAQTPVSGGLSVGSPAPGFTLPDLWGKQRSLASLQAKRALALFFFCGCSRCAAVARDWAQLQRSSALSGDTAARRFTARGDRKQPVSAPSASAWTIVVFQGGADGARELAVASGLVRERTTFLCDAAHRVTLQYQADPCPRVFVLDRKGVIRYVNNGPDDLPESGPSVIIASKALAALTGALTERP
jgi:peroxiredoxin